MEASDSIETPVDGLIPVARFDDLEQAREYALVVLAMNLDCLITVEAPGYVLHSEAAFAQAITEEFRLYTAEQEEVVVPAAPIPVFGSGVNLALAWVLVLFYCFTRQLEDSGVTERFLIDSVRMWEGGEWYRAFTALFLHADLEHLLGNAAIGTVFGIFTANSFGPLRGWSLILLSGFIGNLLALWIRFPDAVRSLGASTAVFGALGLLVASGLWEIWRQKSYRPGMRALGPLLAGVMIFSMNGIGGPETDTLAHLTGMFGGLVLGLPMAFLMSNGSWLAKLRFDRNK